MDSFKKKIRHVISKELAIASDTEKWKNSTDIFTLVEIDSQALLGLIVALEAEFTIRIDDTTLNLDVFKSVNSLSKFLNS